MLQINLLRDHGINVMNGSCPVAKLRQTLSDIEIVAKSPALAALNNDEISEGDLLRAITELNVSGEKLGFVILFA